MVAVFVLPKLEWKRVTQVVMVVEEVDEVEVLVRCDGGEA